MKRVTFREIALKVVVEGAVVVVAAVIATIAANPVISRAIARNPDPVVVSAVATATTAANPGICPAIARSPEAAAAVVGVATPAPLNATSAKDMGISAAIAVLR